MDIAPDKQNIDSLFSNTNYYIDFYQREYRWTKDEVERLLNDVFYKFDQHYNEGISAKPEVVTEHYPWYYLNTYITNKDKGRTYIVDGQQRLTTLTLILIKLYHMCDQYPAIKADRKPWVQSKILGVGAEGKEFWMGHEQRKPVLQNLFENPMLESVSSFPDLTSTNMVANYQIISAYLEAKLKTQHLLETFIIFFLKRLVLINLDVVQTDVPMVFEVINDRGMRLQPYEILKGKLLGQINKSEVDHYNHIWETAIRDLANGERADDFFRTYLKARFATTRGEGRKFDGDYHRAIFDEPYNAALKLKNSSAQVKAFLENEFSYYSRLFLRLMKLGESLDDAFPHVYYNTTLTEMENQVMLILAACRLNDPEEDHKIHAISRLLDRTYVLLQLNKSYDSNRFTEHAYALNSKLQATDIASLNAVFEAQLLEAINEHRSSSIKTPFEYSFFKEAGYQDYNTVFMRYFFARVEQYICQGLGEEMKDTIKNLVRRTGAPGYHIEHILGRNNQNYALYDRAEDANHETFERERNRLGGLLLLKGKDNQSSSNEPYKKKLKTYLHTLCWNQTLLKDFYKSHTSMKAFMKTSGLAFKPIPDTFGPDALESRSRLLFEILKKIWA